MSKYNSSTVVVSYGNANHLIKVEKSITKFWNKPLSLWPKAIFPDMPVSKMMMKSGEPGKA